MESWSLKTYAQRLLNPFRGAMHTLRYHAAEAVTVDGVHWDIYVANTAVIPASGRERRGQISEIRYGKWSQAAGLRRGRLYPSDDFRRMEAVGAVLYEHLTRTHQQLPFAFKDPFELWLLDREARPLALLDSALDQSQLKHDLATDWRAGIAACERFHSQAMAGLQSGTTPAANAGQYLTGYINARAGKPSAAQWFRRADDGLDGIRLPAGLESRTLPSEAFPPLFLDTTGHNAPHQQLIEDFQARQAPWLLLPLDVATRRALEQQARRQTLLVDLQHRLYPACIDDNFTPAARVEAQLRRSQQRPEQEQNDALAPFYTELNQNSEEQT